MKDFDVQLQHFIMLANTRKIKEFIKQFPNLTPHPYKVSGKGRKYVKIVSERSVWVFVEKETGNILKAAGFNTPAKGVRGNIFNENPLQGTNIYGANYL